MGKKEYSTEAHGGAGRGQNLYPPAAGEDYNKKTRGNRHPVGVKEASRHQGNGKDYQKDAHSGAYHGKSGKAVGKKGDAKIPGPYDQKTHEEGAPIGKPDTGPTFVPAHNHGTTNKAAHHPRSGEGQVFRGSPAVGAHGYGHPADLRRGALRLSGHKGAHRLGCK